MIKAFRRNLAGDLPNGSTGLDKKAVMKYSANLYELDGLLAYRRAQVMGRILHGLNARQKAALAMGKRDYSISTSLTGDSGRDFLATLNADQRKLITDLVDLQRDALE